jgi:hypothetical protein
MVSWVIYKTVKSKILRKSGHLRNTSVVCKKLDANFTSQEAEL